MAAAEGFKREIAKLVSQLSGLQMEVIFPILEHPKNDSHGDYSLPVPRLKLPGNPATVASEWAKLCPLNESVHEVNSIGPFLNFKINREALTKSIVKQILTEKENFGTNQLGSGKTVVVEFSSPNIAKPFHVGHLRSTIIGNFLRNLYKANGYKVVAINYLGDWGKQYGLLALGFTKYGSEEKLLENPIKHLFDVYVKINNDAKEDPNVHVLAKEYFCKMEQGEEEYLALWKRFREISILKYKEQYAKLNIEFDVYSGESFYDNAMKDIVDLLKEKELLTESQGAQIVDLESHKLGVAVILKNDGSSLYLTRDLAAMRDRFQLYDFDKMIYVVATAQDLHFKQVFKVCELMGFPFSSKCQHVNFGMVLGQKGSPLATREGNSVFLEDIINQSTNGMHEVMKANAAKYAQIEDPLMTSETLAISAIMIQDMSARRIKDYTFNMERMMSFEGDTGPYLQYAHSRLVSIERKSNLTIDENQSIDLLVEKEAHNLAVLLSRYPDLITDTMKTQEPCQIVTYLFDLCHLLSTTLEKLYVLGQEEPIAKARLALYTAARYTLGNGMKILGLKPLERM